MYQLEIRDVLGLFIDEAFDYSDDDEIIKAFLEGMVAAIPIITKELTWHGEDKAELKELQEYPDDFSDPSLLFGCPESSVISDVEYWPKVKELFIHFKKTDKTYAYQNVPRNIYNDLRDSESRGKYFNQHIKTKFKYVDVSDKKENDNVN